MSLLLLFVLLLLLLLVFYLLFIPPIPFAVGMPDNDLQCCTGICAAWWHATTHRTHVKCCMLCFCCYNRFSLLLLHCIGMLWSCVVHHRHFICFCKCCPALICVSKQAACPPECQPLAASAPTIRLSTQQSIQPTIHPSVRPTVGSVLLPSLFVCC